MTTAKSPPEKLRAQAHHIAETLKRSAIGEKVADDPAGKIPASKERGSLKAAIVMDDKIINIDVPWATIEAASIPELCEFIFEQMSEAP